MKQTFIRIIGLLGITSASLSTTAQNSIEWGPAGPLYTAGRIRNIIIDMNDPSGNTIYAGSAAGGIFKTTNAGSLWAAINDQDPIKNISYMAQSPSSKVIYAATGEGFLSYTKKEKAKPGTGLYKLSGNDLVLVQGASVVGNVINRIACFGDKIAVAGSNGILVSHDNGGSFTAVTLPGYTVATNSTKGYYGMDVKFDANGLLYCTLGNERGHGIVSGFTYPDYSKIPSRVFKSTDAGLTTFANITPISTIVNSNYGRIELAIAHGNNNIVYASCANKNTSQPIGPIPVQGSQKPESPSLNAIFVSYNGGTTWAIFKQGSSALDPFSNGGTQAVGDYAHTMIVAQDDDNFLLFGGYSFYILFRTGGTDAQPLVSGFPIGSNGFQNSQYYLHENIHDIKVVPGTPAKFYFVTDAGIFRSLDLTSANQGSPPSFQPFYKGLATGQFNSVAIERYPSGTKTDGKVTPFSGFAGGTAGNGLVYYSGTADQVTSERSHLSGDIMGTEYSKILYNAVFTSSANGGLFRSADVRTSNPPIINLNTYSGGLGVIAPSPGPFNTVTLKTGTPFKLWESYGRADNPDRWVFYNDSLRMMASISGVGTLTTQTTFTFDVSRPNASASLDSIVVRTASVSIPGDRPSPPVAFSSTDKKDVLIKLLGPSVSQTVSIGTGSAAVTGTYAVHSGTNIVVTGPAVANSASVLVNAVTHQTLISLTYSAAPFAAKTTATIQGVPDPAAYYRVFATLFYKYKVGDTVKVKDERISTMPIDYSGILTQPLSWAYGTYPGYTLASTSPSAVSNPTYFLNPGGISQSSPVFSVNVRVETPFTITQYSQRTLVVPPVTHTIVAMTNTTTIPNPTFVLEPGTVTQTSANPVFTVFPLANMVYTITTLGSGTISLVTTSAVGASTYMIDGGSAQPTNSYVVSPTVNTTYTLTGVSSDTVTGKNTSSVAIVNGAVTSVTVGTPLNSFPNNNQPVKFKTTLAARLAFFLNNPNTQGEDAIVVSKSPLNMNDPMALVRLSTDGCLTDDANGNPTDNIINIVGRPIVLEWSKSGTELYYATDKGNLYRISHITDIMDLSPGSYSGKFLTDVFMYAGSSQGQTINPVSPYRTTLIGSFNPTLQITSINVSNDDKNLVVTFDKTVSGGTTAIVMTNTNDIRGAVNLSNPNSMWVKKGGAEIDDKTIYCAIMEMSNNKEVLVGTDLGIYRTTDISQNPPTWTKVNNNQLPNVQILDMKQQTLRAWDCYNSGEIYVATNGRGVWRTSKFYFPYVEGIDESTKISVEPNHLNMFPNPTNGQVTVAFNGIDGENVVAYVMDLSGRIVFTSQVGKLSGGDTTYSFDTNQLSAGVYIVSISSDNGGKRTGKLVVTK